MRIYLLPLEHCVTFKVHEVVYPERAEYESGACYNACSEIEDCNLPNGISRANTGF